MLSQFDIFKAAGAKNKAILQQFTKTANSAGQYVLTFTSVVDNSLVSALAIQ